MISLEDKFKADLNRLYKEISVGNILVKRDTTGNIRLTVSPFPLTYEKSEQSFTLDQVITKKTAAKSGFSPFDVEIKGEVKFADEDIPFYTRTQYIEHVKGLYRQLDIPFDPKPTNPLALNAFIKDDRADLSKTIRLAQAEYLKNADENKFVFAKNDILPDLNQALKLNFITVHKVTGGFILKVGQPIAESKPIHTHIRQSDFKFSTNGSAPIPTEPNSLKLHFLNTLTNKQPTSQVDLTKASLKVKGKKIEQPNWVEYLYDLLKAAGGRVTYNEIGIKVNPAANYQLFEILNKHTAPEISISRYS